MGNQVTICINNCKECTSHYTEKIYTSDSFEHITGLFCSKVEDKNSENHKHKLVAEDDWDVYKYSEIPDWCPLLDKNNATDNVKIMFVVGMPKTFKSFICDAVSHDLGVINKDPDIMGWTSYYVNNIHSTIKQIKQNNTEGSFIISIEAQSSKMEEIDNICKQYGNNCRAIYTFDETPKEKAYALVNSKINEIKDFFAE